jgi:hypothetical protein
MNDLALAFAALVRSTADLHERFGTRQTVDEALDCLREEMRELTDAAAFNMDWVAGERHVREEAVDVIVTLLGVLRAWYIRDGAFADTLLTVAMKNDAKTHLTHEVNAAGKIARKEQA